MGEKKAADKEMNNDIERDRWSKFRLGEWYTKGQSKIDRPKEQEEKKMKFW